MKTAHRLDAFVVVVGFNAEGKQTILTPAAKDDIHDAIKAIFENHKKTETVKLFTLLMQPDPDSLTYKRENLNRVLTEHRSPTTRIDDDYGSADNVMFDSTVGRAVRRPDQYL